MEIPVIFEARIPQADSNTLREAREEYHAPPKPYFVNEERGIRLYQGDAMELLKRTNVRTWPCTVRQVVRESRYLRLGGDDIGWRERMSRLRVH